MQFDPDPTQMKELFGHIADSGKVVELCIPETRKVWKFPAERFVEYGPEDESWCRGLFIGEEVEEVIDVKASGFVSGFTDDGMRVQLIQKNERNVAP